MLILQAFPAAKILNCWKETVELEGAWGAFSRPETALSTHSQETRHAILDVASVPARVCKSASPPCPPALGTRRRPLGRPKRSTLALLSNTRLAPEMFPLVRQVQVARDQGRNGAARLAGIEPPRYDDTETTIPSAQDAHRRHHCFPQDVGYELRSIP